MVYGEGKLDSTFTSDLHIGYSKLRKQYGNSPQYKDFFDNLYIDGNEVIIGNNKFSLLKAEHNGIDIIDGNYIDKNGVKGNSGLIYFAGNAAKREAKKQGKKMFSTLEEVKDFLNSLPGHTSDTSMYGKLDAFLDLFEINGITGCYHLHEKEWVTLWATFMQLGVSDNFFSTTKKFGFKRFKDDTRLLSFSDKVALPILVFESIKEKSHSKLDAKEISVAAQSLDILKGVEQYLQYAPESWKKCFQKFNPLDQKYLMENIEFLSDRTNIITIMKEKKVKISVAKDLFVADKQLLQDFPNDVREYNGKTFISGPKAREIIPENLQLTGPILIAIAKMMPDRDFALGKIGKSNKYLFDLLGMGYDGYFKVDYIKYMEKGLKYVDGKANYQAPSPYNLGYLMTPTRHKETGNPYILYAKDSLNTWEKEKKDIGVLEQAEKTTLAPLLTLKAPIEELV